MTGQQSVAHTNTPLLRPSRPRVSVRNQGIQKHCEENTHTRTQSSTLYPPGHHLSAAAPPPPFPSSSVTVNIITA